MLIPVSPAPSSMKHLMSANLDQPPTCMEAGEISVAPVPVGNAVIGGWSQFLSPFVIVSWSERSGENLN